MLANDEFEQQHVEGRSFAHLWKHYLLELQLSAPKPKRVVCSHPISNKPSYYGREFHGELSRESANELLSGEDGRYLVRESVRSPGQYTLSLRFNGTTKNFKLYYNGQHFVGEKHFDTIHDLVADGLIILHLELHAKDYINSIGSHCKYQESPYMTIRNPRKKINELSKAQRKAAFEIKRISIHEADEEAEETRPETRPFQQRQTQLQATGNDQTMGRFLRDHLDPQFDVQQFEKRHAFKVHNYMGLPFCDFCGNFMWGILAQGVKCEDCGFNAHKRCSEKVPNDCCPDLKYVLKVFGIDLTLFVKAYNVVRPFIIEEIVKEIENRGLHIEGLYRVSGFVDDVEALKDRLESHWESAEQVLRTSDDVHVITGVLKLYFRLLPVPLISFDAYPHMINSLKKATQCDRIVALKDAIANHLPPAHLHTLKYLLAHLYRLSSMSEVNLMTIHNISTVFAPTLMRTPNIGLNKFQMDSWHQETNLLELLIAHHSKLFK